jgi:ubiquinone/menaquinone biosynthesis C-methylase UbiE
MESQDALLNRVALLKPDDVLDVGCGCGAFTAKLSPYCGKITAVDHSQALIDRCKKENGKPNVVYGCMDGRELAFPDGSFDLVLERTALHHVSEWQKVLDEMIRVSSKHILIEEPIDDPRSEEKKNAIRARKLYLKLQQEVGYPHFEYLLQHSLIDHFRRREIPTESEIVRSDKLVDFDQFFGSFGDFAEKSNRRQYWYDRLEDLRQELASKMLCEEDIVFISAVKP